MEVDKDRSDAENRKKGKGKGPQSRAAAAMAPPPKAKPSRYSSARGSMNEAVEITENIPVEEIKGLSIQAPTEVGGGGQEEGGDSRSDGMGSQISLI